MTAIPTPLPTARKNRLVPVDILRGLAVFGVLLVNGPSINSPVTLDGVDFAFKEGAANIFYSDVILSFAVCNFYPIFACLFGVSAAILLAKNSTAIYKRRMFMLLLFGMCQAILIWWGDVLVAYALLGFGLLSLANKPMQYVKRALVITAIFAVILSVLVLAVGGGSEFYPDNNFLLTYQQGSFVEVTRLRVFDFLWTYIPWLVVDTDITQFFHSGLYLMQLYLCFSFGFYVYASGLLQKIIDDKVLAQKIFWYSLALTIVVTAVQHFFSELDSALYVLHGFSRAIFYSSSILYGCHFQMLYRFLSPLAKVGQMSLSNYLTHNLILSLLFYGYGLQYYGTMGPFDQAPYLFSMMIGSLILSALWLKFFAFGPIEWIWRMVTYKRYIPIVRSTRPKSEQMGLANDQ